MIHAPLRVWHAKDEEMIVPPHNYYVGSAGKLYYQPDGRTFIRALDCCIANASTGITDDRNDLVYQGDIVEPQDNFSYGPMDVRWQQEDGAWAAGPEWFLGTLVKVNEVRKIGDIYRTPELLEQQPEMR